MSRRPHESGLVYFVADGLTLLIESSVYFISLLPAVARVLNVWEGGVRHTLLSRVVAWYLSALVFILVIVGIKRILVGGIRPGRYMLTSRRAFPWIAVDCWA